MIKNSMCSRNLWKATVSVAALAIAAWPAATWAQSAPDAPTTVETDDAVTEAIVVTGTRRSLEDALATKRASTEIIDSISAEGVGKLPDLNLAESLQRVPGIQISRSARVRLGTVSLRGLPSAFAQTLVNGQYIASPDVSNFSFGTVRSEVFSGIDVIKAQSAKSMTGGLSGLINLRTGDPFAAGKNSINLSVDGYYEELTGKLTPGAALSINQEIIPDVLAIRAAVGFKRSDFRYDILQINSYDRIAGAATSETVDDQFAPRQIRLPFERVRGDAWSASTGIEYRPTDELKAKLFGFYNNYRSNAYTSQYTAEFRTGSTRTTIGTPTNEGPLGSTFSNVRIDNPAVIVDSRFQDERYKTSALTGNLEWSNDVWTLGGTVHYTKGTRTREFTGYQAVQAPLTAAGGNGLSFLVDTGAGNSSNFVYDLNRAASGLVNLGQPFGAPIAPTYREIRATGTLGASVFGGFRNEGESEDELAIQVDLERSIDFGPFSAVQLGAVYRDKSQSQRQSLAGLFGAQLAQLNNSLYDFSQLSGGREFFSGRAAIGAGDYAELDVRAITAAITPVNATSLPSALYFVGTEGLVNFIDTTSLAAIYDNKQKIYGGYAMADFDQDLGGVRLRGNIGARYEKSERSTLPSRTTTPLDFDYANFLPLANVILDIGDRVVLRGSYTKTIRRPQVDSFAVLRSIAVDGSGGLVTANLGATELRPFKSQNLDLTLEFYNRGGSSISVAGFYKKVTDFAGTTRICPADGGAFGFGALTQASGTCRTVNATPAQGSFPAVQAGAQVNIGVTANQDAFDLYGFEMSAQQNLDFLPAPWNGFGGQVNYTNVNFKSKGTFRISELSKHTFNAILYYETPQFQVRGAYNIRSGYFLEAAGTAFGGDRLVKARPQLDLSASVNLTDRLALSAEAFNVTNKNLYEYEGAQTRARAYTHYGRTFSFGLRYRLQ